MALQEEVTAVGDWYCVNCDNWWTHLYLWMPRSQVDYCHVCGDKKTIGERIKQMIDLSAGRFTPYIKVSNRWVEDKPVETPPEEAAKPYKD